MANQPDYRANGNTSLRALFCFGVQPAFFKATRDAFDDLSGRFGVQVLGTLDDDELMVGPSVAFPWTAYVLADAPDLGAVTAVCNLLRETRVGEDRLWRFMRVEARIGRPLFFAEA